MADKNDAREWLLDNAVIRYRVRHGKYIVLGEMTRERLEGLLTAYAAAVTQERDALDSELRQMLWLGHGHEALYGDDGEMQCGMCAPFGCTDYKREPLEVLRKAFHDVQMFRVSQARTAAEESQPK